jgi:VCBS repeat-containing protein
MQKLSGLFLFTVIISGAFSSSFAFALEPIANNDLYSINEDSVLTVGSNGILINDINIDNRFFAIIQTSVGFGTLTLDLDGSFTYTPNSNFNSNDSFTYIVTNGTYSSNNATVTLSVNPVNDAPIAQNNTATTSENTSVIIPVLNNDSDIDGNSFTINSITQGVNGTVTTNGTTITYTPKLSFHGTDSFNYTISDGMITSNSAIVTVLVTSISDNTDTTPEEKELIAQLKALKDDFKAKEKELKEQLKALKDDFKAKEKELKEQLKEFKKDNKSHDNKNKHDHEDKQAKGHDNHEDKKHGKGHEKYDRDHNDDN